MQSNRAKALVAVVSIALIVVLFVVLSGGDDEGSDGGETGQVQTTTDSEPTGGSGAGERSGGGQEKPPGDGDLTTIVVVGGEPEGGVQNLEFDKGDEIRFAVSSDVADEVHVHGYEIEEEVEPGKPVEFAFPAEIDGVFEVELHGSGAQLAQLTVNP